MTDKRMRKLIHRARRYYLAPTAPIAINEAETKAALEVVSLTDILNESLREYKIKLHRARKIKEANYALFESAGRGNNNINVSKTIARLVESLDECELYEKAIDVLTKRTNKSDIITYLSLLEGEKIDKEKKDDFSDKDGIEPEDEEEEEISGDEDLEDIEDIDLEEPEAEDDEDAEGDLDAEEGDTVNLEKIAITVTDIDRIKKELKDYGIPEEAIEEDDVEDNEDQDGEVRKGKVKIDSEYALELRDFFKEKYDIDLEEKLGIEIEETEEGDDGTNADSDDEKDSDDEDYSDDDIFKVDKEDDFDDFFGDDDEEEDDEE